jgi:hypothetical protein
VPNTEVVGTSAWIAENAQRYEGAVTYDLNNIHPYTFQTSNSSGNADWKSDTYYCWHKNGRGLYTGGMEYAEGGEGSLHTIGRMRSKFKWVRSNPNDNPPDVLVVKIIASVGAYSNSITSNDPNHPDRDVAKEHVMVEMSAEEYSATPAGKHDYYDGALDQWLSHDFAQMKRLMPVETNGQDVVWGPWVDIKAKADVDGGRITNPPDSSFQILSGIVWVEANYEAQPDNRSVHISSPTIDQSYYKHYQFGLPVQDPHVRADDGSISVDSAASWDEIRSDWITVGNLFTANTPNFQSPTYQWKLSGDGTPLTIFHETQLAADQATLPMSLYLGGETVQFPKTNEFKVTVTDTDGAAGTNTYNVTWRHPYDNPHPYADPDPYWETPELEIASPGYANNNGSISANWNLPNPYWGATRETLTAAGIAVRHPYWAMMFKAAGFLMDNAAQSPNTGSANFDDCWASSGSIWDVPPAATSTPEELNAEQNKYRMIPVRKEKYTIKFIEADHYNVHGYEGPYRRVFSVKGASDGTVEEAWVGDFRKNQNGGGGGGGQ